MATNNFKPFAIGGGANVTSQTDYEALAALITGFQSGKASSAQINKALRQSSVMSYVLAQFISDSASVDVLDNGTPATILANMKAAMTALTPGRLLGVQKLTGSGTYTPTPGTKKIIVELVGGGGAGGGAFAGSNTTSSAGAGGSSGAYGKAVLNSVPSSVNVVIGIGGGGTSGGKGGNGGTTIFGSLSASGGIGGKASSYAGSATYTDVTSGTSDFSGDFIEAMTGGYSSIGLMLSASFCFGGGGGNSKIGTGGAVSGLNISGSSSPGTAPSASNYGAGGSGGVSTSATSVSGGNGSNGVVIVWEYA